MNNQQIIVRRDCNCIGSNMKPIDDYMDWMRDRFAPYLRVYIVHGEHSYYSCGAADFMNELQCYTQCDYHHFYSFAKNPQSEDVVRGVEDMKRYHPDVIVALGGGSVLDMAKLIRYYSEMSIPLIAIPTTSGTGAESTQFAVCYIDGEKRSISDPKILPDEAVLIPEWTNGNSEYLTACTGFDAFAQAVEAFWNIHATEESDLYAEEALALLVLRLNQFIDGGARYCMENHYWREDMMVGANLAGQAINIARTTAPHAMSYKLTSKYGYAHGHAVAMTFPYFAKLNMECGIGQYKGSDYRRYAEKMRWLRKCFDITNQDIETYFRTFVNKLGLGYKEETKVDTALVAQSINLERAGNNPHTLTAEIINQAAQSILKMK